MLNVQLLKWDSHFFGFGVGRLTGPFESRSTLVAALRAAADSGLHLVYGVSAHADSVSHQIALAAGGRLVDTKRTYARDLTMVQPKQLTFDFAESDRISRRQLRSLTLQTAEFSRFRLDPALPAGSWRRMYSAWIRNSLNGQLADEVLVERADGRIIGMITISHDGKRGQIGLFGVNHRWRGQGIGRRLLEAALQRCLAKGCGEILVATQGNNIAACRSYEHAGYSVIDEQDIFHFWIDRT